MSIRISIQSIGVDKVQKHLKRFAMETTTVIQSSTLAESAAKIVRTAKSLLPNHWLLRQAIGRKVMKSKYGGGFAIIGVKRGYKKRGRREPAQYARYQEYGYFTDRGQKQRGRHFMKRAYERHQNVLEQVMYYRLQRKMERQMKDLQ